jgi:hypothetical protein
MLFFGSPMLALEPPLLNDKQWTTGRGYLASPSYAFPFIHRGRTLARGIAIQNSIDIRFSKIVFDEVRACFRHTQHHLKHQRDLSFLFC